MIKLKSNNYYIFNILKIKIEIILFYQIYKKEIFIK